MAASAGLGRKRRRSRRGGIKTSETGNNEGRGALPRPFACPGATPASLALGLAAGRGPEFVEIRDQERHRPNVVVLTRRLASQYLAMFLKHGVQAAARVHV